MHAVLLLVTAKIWMNESDEDDGTQPKQLKYTTVSYTHLTLPTKA